MSRKTRIGRVFLPAMLASFSAGIVRGDATVLSDNLAEATGGTEYVTDMTLVAASFRTDGATHLLASAALLLANPSQSGTATLSLYSDATLEPGNLVATLDSPDHFFSTLEQTRFTGSGIVLAPHTVYWVILEAQDGDFLWAWSGSNSGQGPGFINTWAISPETDGGWWSIDSYSTQLQVIAAPLVRADVNLDGHVDLIDYAIFWACITGPDQTYDVNNLPEGCTAPADGGVLLIDQDIDGDVDLGDFHAFERCYTGPMQFVDASCDD